MLADQIVSLRKRAGMSQLQLSEILNIGPSTIGMYEQGRRTPSIETLIQMANLFEVSLDYLLTGREARYWLTTEKDAAEQVTCPCGQCYLYHNLSGTGNRRNQI